MYSASAPTRVPPEIEIMQLMEVVVPQQDDVVSCGVHVIPNCKSIFTHMTDGPGVGSWVPPSKAIREEETPPCLPPTTSS
jgi:hypothetical protein